MYDLNVKQNMILGLSNTEKKSSESINNFNEAVQVIKEITGQLESQKITFGKVNNCLSSVNNSISKVLSYLENSSALNNNQDPNALSVLRSLLYQLMCSSALFLDEHSVINIHKFLMKLAQKLPINETSLITYDFIPSEQRVYTSSGHCFDILELIHCYKKNKFINPYSNSPFTLIDACHILNFCIEYNQKNKNKDLRKFLSELMNPIHVVYKNNLLFLLDKSSNPIGVLEISLNPLNLPKEKNQMILSSKNLVQVLYDKKISTEDIKDIHTNNLKIIGIYKKAVSTLENNPDKFLKQLKTKSNLEIFSMLNSKSNPESPAPEKQSIHHYR